MDFPNATQLNSTYGNSTGGATIAQFITANDGRAFQLSNVYMFFLHHCWSQTGVVQANALVANRTSYWQKLLITLENDAKQN